MQCCLHQGSVQAELLKLLVLTILPQRASDGQQELRLLLNVLKGRKRLL